MGKIEKFEDIVAWQKARVLCKEIYKTTNEGLLSKDFSLKDQIRRSSGSVMDNIAEGFERGGNKEFIHFLTISKASNSEVRSQLYRAYDQEYISKERFEFLYRISIEVGNLIHGFIKYLKSSDFKGNKFKK